MSQDERDSLTSGEYQVNIDTAFKPDGSMTLMQAELDGETEQEVLISVNTCHPSLANNELSGPILATHLFKRIAAWSHRRYRYRFVFVPETIGALALLSRCGEELRENLIAGLVLTCIGDRNALNYKRSRRGNSLVDRAMEHTLSHHADDQSVVYDFTPWGSDERQYCSPGFNLPVGTLMRSVPGQYDSYHTSLDDKSVIDFDGMGRSLNLIESALRIVDCNRTYRSLSPFGEPKLDKHGLYSTQGGMIDQPEWLFALRWVLNLSDGNHDLLTIAERGGMPFDIIAQAATQAVDAGILEAVD